MKIHRILEATTNFPASELKVEMNNIIKMRGWVIVEEINEDERTAIIDILLRIIKNDAFIEQILSLIKD
jgi:ribosomal protein S8